MTDFENMKYSILTLTNKYVKELSTLWGRMFDPNICEDHMRKLEEHAKNFYEDLVTETLEKKAHIENEISELHNEAETLQRLLNTEVQLPTINMSDVPLQVLQSEMDKSLYDLRETLRRRREEICELLLEQDALCEELGEPPRPLVADPLPTAEKIDDFRVHLEQLKVMRVERMNEIIVLRREIKSYLKTLDLTPITDVDDRLLNQRQFKLDQETIETLKRMRQRYSDQVEELCRRIDSMRLKIAALWERLQENDAACKNLIQQKTDYTQQTHDILSTELQRCETLRRQNIKKYVEQLRREIAIWWEKTLASNVERKRFSNYRNDCFTEDLLALHELELDDLKRYYSTNQQIFELFDNRKVLWERMTALEAKANEPGRYNNRGGQLLKEERERKTIASKLPKIEQKITELVKQFEEREKTSFNVYGENIIELMAGEWERKRQAKEQLSTARKNAQTPQTGSKVFQVKNATTMSTTNASLRKTPSTTQLGNHLGGAMTTGCVNKRKINEKAATAPHAKRSLMHALNSPSVFLKPSTTTRRRSNSNSKTSTKPLQKKPLRVIATFIHRKSTGRQSVKRRSLNKSGAKTKGVPDIVLQRPTSSSDEGISSVATYSNDDTYDSFLPASRSSLLPAAKTTTKDRKRKIVISTLTSQKQKSDANCKQLPINDENMRLVQLPKPCISQRTTQSKQQHLPFSGSNTLVTIANAAHSPISGSNNVASSRKLATKNLPIII